MSFRVQCSENYHGPNCATFCEPVEVNPNTNCTTCLYIFYDIKTGCTQCLPGRDITSNCTTCLPDYDASTSCTTCLQAGYDPTAACTQCLTGRDVSTNCKTCLPGYDHSTNCAECLSNAQCQPTQTTSDSTASTTSSKYMTVQFIIS